MATLYVCAEEFELVEKKFDVSLERTATMLAIADIRHWVLRRMPYSGML